MSKLQVLLHKVINFLRRPKVSTQPGRALPVIEVVKPEDLPPGVLEDVMSQLLSDEGDDDTDMQLLSAEINAQGNPRLVVHTNRDITEIVDAETLQLLDAEWDKAVKAKGNHKAQDGRNN